MSASHKLQQVLTLTAFAALLFGSIVYAFTCAPAIVEVELTHVGGHDQAPEESLILEDQYAAQTLSLSLPGEDSAKWVTAIELFEHDEHRTDAALRGFWRTPAGVLFLLVLVLLAVRIVYTFG